MEKYKFKESMPSTEKKKAGKMYLRFSWQIQPYFINVEIPLPIICYRYIWIHMEWQVLKQKHCSYFSLLLITLVHKDFIFIVYHKGFSLNEIYKMFIEYKIQNYYKIMSMLCGSVQTK